MCISPIQINHLTIYYSLVVSVPRPDRIDYGLKGPPRRPSPDVYSDVDSEGDVIHTPAPPSPINFDEPSTTENNSAGYISVDEAGVEPATPPPAKTPITTTVAQLGAQYRVNPTRPPNTARRSLPVLQDQVSRRLERISNDRIKKQERRARGSSKYCAICKKNINSNQYLSHITGGVHKKNKRREDEQSLDLTCKLCNTAYNNLHDLKRHLSSNAHTQRLLNKRNNDERERLSRNTPS